MPGHRKSIKNVCLCKLKNKTNICKNLTEVLKIPEKSNTAKNNYDDPWSYAGPCKIRRASSTTSINASDFLGRKTLSLLPYARTRPSNSL